ncbi:30S ribosomal protein S6 [Patescibacteria group bacterium]|nr:30S ribosomal protein S6 [Patescibacteria group bacterium]
MKYYELTYLVSPELSEEKIKNFSEKTNSFIKEEGGSLGKVKNPLKRELGYLIKKRGTAYLISVDFHLDSKKLENLEKKLKSESQVLRYVITKKEKKVIEIPAKIFRKEPVLRKVSGKEIPAPERPGRAPKVELKEIEKKLEEILGE